MAPFWHHPGMAASKGPFRPSPHILFSLTFTTRH